MAWDKSPMFYMPPKSTEEKIEEARRSGLIKDATHLNGPNQLVMCCKRCGSRNILVGMPAVNDREKGVEIPYYCKDCDYTGTRNARVKGMSGEDDSVLEVELIPDGLVGVVGSMTGQTQY